MAGLWPLHSGRLLRPVSSVLTGNRGRGALFVPQTTYLTEGTLREQVYIHD